MARSPWELVIELDRDAALPPFLQIARALAADIQRGRLRRRPLCPAAAGSREPSRPSQYRAGGVGRADRGRLDRDGAGARHVRHARASVQPRGRPFSRRLGVRAQRAGPASPFALPEPPAAYRPPSLPRGTLNLSNGAPDVRLVPARAIGRAYRRVLALRGADAARLRRSRGTCRRCARRWRRCSRARAGLPVGADDVLVTRGSQMALTLAARALLRPGDVVAVEQFGYRPAWEAFRAAGATVVPVAIDRDGIDVDALAAAREPHAASRGLRHAASSVSDDGDA